MLNVGHWETCDEEINHIPPISFLSFSKPNRFSLHGTNTFHQIKPRDYFFLKQRKQLLFYVFLRTSYQIYKPHNCDVRFYNANYLVNSESEVSNGYIKRV